MEMIKTTGFCEMTDDEMKKVDGGVDPLTVAAGIVAVGGAFYVCYQLGEAVGKAGKNVYNWVRSWF